MLTVDNRQLQYRLDKLEADYRQESEKVNMFKRMCSTSKSMARNEWLGLRIPGISYESRL